MEAIATLISNLLTLPGQVNRLLHRAATARLNHSIDERDWLIRYADTKGISLLSAEKEVVEYLDDCLA